MPNDEPTIAPAPGAASTPLDPSGTTPGRSKVGYGLAMSSFLDRYPVIRRRKWFIAWSLAPLFAAGMFIATHRVEASGDADVSCSSYTAAQLVGDIIKERVFASGAKVMLDPDRFGGKLVDIAMISDRPLTCSASFVPTLAFSKAVLDDAARSGTTKAALDEIHTNAVDKYSAMLKYKVRDNGSGKVYVTVTDGLDAFDD